MTWQSEATHIQADGVQAMAAFSGSISSLCSTTDQMSQLCQTLLEINGADSALEQLQQLGKVVEEMCQFLDSWLVRSDTGALRMNFLRIRADLEDIKKLGTRFKVVASLTAINAGNTNTDMGDFIEELRAVPPEIGAAVDSLLGRVASVDDAVKEAIATARTGLKAMGIARRILVSHSSQSQAVFRQIVESREAMKLIGHLYLSTSKEQNKVLVHSFQYSDFFAQRVDHVSQMLAKEDELGSSVRLLAASQLLSLAEHGQHTLNDIQSALQAQSISTAKFAADFDVQGKSGSDGNIGLQSIFERVLISRERALPAIAQSVASSRHVLEEIGKCNESFAKLVEMSGVMDLAAINARLRASREVNSREAMSFLSDAVMVGACTCRDVLSNSSENLAEVAAIQDKEMLDQLLDCMSRFTTAFDMCKEGLAESEARIANLSATLTEVTSLIGSRDEMVSQCATTARDLSRTLQDMVTLAGALSADLAEPSIWPDLSEIYDTYTIQTERDTHDRRIGRPIAPPVSTQPLDLDDVFF